MTIHFHNYPNPPLPMSRILFRDQPPELQEYIIEEIDSAMDLLALALSSKYFHKMIVPHHIHFRRLRCYLQREDVWTFLLENPHLCARFRVLEIIRRSRLPISGSEHLILPWCLEKETRISSRTAPSETGTQRTATLDLVRAVCQSMPRLRFFKWVDEGGINPTPVQPLADILSAVVQSCPPLQSVEILPRLSTCMGYSSASNGFHMYLAWRSADVRSRLLTLLQKISLNSLYLGLRFHPGPLCPIIFS